MRKNCGFPCGVNSLRLLATNAARRTPCSQGEDRTAIRVPSGQNAQQPRRASSDQEGDKQSYSSDSGQESAERLKASPEG